MQRFIPFIFAVMAASLAGCDSTTDTTDTITTAELAMRVESGSAPLILDVRTADEYAEAHIPGAININHMELPDRLAELAEHKQDEIVVHCASGRRAALAETALRDAGFADVRDLEGHMQQWIESGYPVQRTEGKPGLDDET
jgi:phage shock protein E